MNYFRCGGGSEKVTIDGEKVKDKLKLQSYMFSAVKVDDQSPATSGCSAIVYDGEIHLIGVGGSEGNAKKHYKWDGTTWTQLSDLPFNAYNSAVVVCNDEIHVLGSTGTNKYYKTHYKWDGTTWTQLSDLPYSESGNVRNFHYVVFNNEIHLLSGSYYNNSTYYIKKHYKWDGTTWTRLSDLPFYTQSGFAVVYNNAIHMLGGQSYYGSSDYPTQHYKWDGTTWTRLSDLPFKQYGMALIYKGEIYSIGNNSGEKTCYKWDGTTWTRLSDLPFSIRDCKRLVVVYNNEIHMIRNYENDEHLVLLVPFYVSLSYNVLGVYFSTI